jgi:hypothetical protein
MIPEVLLTQSITAAVIVGVVLALFDWGRG